MISKIWWEGEASQNAHLKYNALYTRALQTGHYNIGHLLFTQKHVDPILYDAAWSVKIVLPSSIAFCRMYNLVESVRSFMADKKGEIVWKVDSFEDFKWLVDSGIIPKNCRLVVRRALVDKEQLVLAQVAYLHSLGEAFSVEYFMNALNLFGFVRGGVAEFLWEKGDITLSLPKPSNYSHAEPLKVYYTLKWLKSQEVAFDRSYVNEIFRYFRFLARSVPPYLLHLMLALVVN